MPDFSSPEDFAAKIVLHLDASPDELTKKNLVRAIRDRDFLMMTSTSNAVGGTI